MTSVLFEKWFKEDFIPSVKLNYSRKNIPFKILLLLDNCTAHPPALLKHIDPNVRVEFLPPNTTSLIQPMDQGKDYKCLIDLTF